MLPTSQERHEDAVEELYQELLFKGKNPKKHIRYGDEDYVLGEMDVMTCEVRNGQTHITYYEVKTGESGPRRTAHSQARAFYKRFLRQPLTVPRFVYYHPTDGVEYWRWRDVIYGNQKERTH